MNWYKIKTLDGSDEGYTYVGSSEDSMEVLAEKATRGQFIRLDNILYNDRGEIKDWSEWDKSIMPTVFVQPNRIITIMQFYGDPRTTPRK